MHGLGNNILTEQDRDNICAFKLCIMSNMSHSVFNQMRHTLGHKLDISSEWVILHRMATLSGVEPKAYDCCINSCMAYTRTHAQKQLCDYCHENHFSLSGKPCWQFLYLPVGPRSTSFFQNKKMVEKLSYHCNYVSEPGTIEDVFDAEHYQTLLKSKVVIDGQEKHWRYFSGKNDIAFSLCTDGYQLLGKRRKGPSATPIVLQNFNLSPEIRIKLDDLICAGVIPGPKPPKDMASFLAPLDDEYVTLAVGLPAYDCVAKQNFTLHAYNIFMEGDIVAMEKMLGIKGHNGFSPCRSCDIKDCRDVTHEGKTYYVPLGLPGLKGKPSKQWNPKKLDKRTHEGFADRLAEIKQAGNKKHAAKLATHYGIREAPIFGRVGSINYARSCPWDWMHLFLLNVIPNLVDHWTGNFKNLDAGTGTFEIAPQIWAEIGEETAAAVQIFLQPLYGFSAILQKIRACLQQSLGPFGSCTLHPLSCSDSSKIQSTIITCVHWLKS